MACVRSLLNFKKCFKNVSYLQARSLRGTIPENAKTLDEKLKDMFPVDEELEKRVDIGFYVPKHLKKKELKERLEIAKQNRNNYELAEKSRNGELVISYEEVRKHWKEEEAGEHIKDIADHYGIFRDLFEYGYFHPSVTLDVHYPCGEENVIPVCTGNIIPPLQAASPPSISYSSSPDTLWTLVMTNLDGHLLDNNYEYLHWFLGNIKSNDISTGEVICDYLQPFVAKGTGYHRFTFILYQQEEYIDYSSLKLPLSETSLKKRTFKTYDFYKARQKVLTPAGLAFFQSTWEDGLTDVFHNVLNMRVPSFEYEHPPTYFAPQIKWPKRKSFNLYLDKFRDQKELREDVYLRRLKELHPFEPEKPRYKYPLVHPFPEGTPSWLETEMTKERMRVGKYRDMRPFSFYPQPEVEPYVNKYEEVTKQEEKLEQERLEQLKTKAKEMHEKAQGGSR